MKNTSFTLLFIWLIYPLSNAMGYTERNLLQKEAGSIEVLKEILLSNQQWVSYPKYNDRKAWDDFLGEYKEEYIREGEELLNYQWKLITAMDYLEFQRSGSRDAMQVPFGLNNHTISKLVIAELAEGKGRFIDQIINGVFQYCEMTTWAVSAHLNMQKNNKVMPDFRENIIDIQVADLGAFLSWIYYFLHEEFDKVNPAISPYLKSEIKRRILDRYMQEPSFWWMSFNTKPGGLINNWNIWTNFNVLQCYLLMEEDKEKLSQAVWRSIQSVDKFINYNKDDGACEEGPGYWGHAAGKLFDYLELLSSATQGRINLFDKPLIKNMAEYIANSYIGKGWIVNFSDASARTSPDNFLLYTFGKAVGSTYMVDMSIARYNSKEAIMPSGKRQCVDLYRALRNQTCYRQLRTGHAIHRYKPYMAYPDSEVCFMSNKNAFFVAAKGGHNDESHNHNDIGTFNLYIDSIPIIIDAGVGTYTRQTFDSNRYGNWGMQSNYHNLPIINGIGQKEGKEFHAQQVVFNEKAKSFSMDISKAYPTEAGVNKWIRSYTLKNDKLIISDTYDLLETKEKNQINFMTWGAIDLTMPGRIIINTKGQKALLEYDMNKLMPSLEEIELTDPKFTSVWGDCVYRISLTAKETANKGSYHYTISKWRN
ncbi:heparinase II/III family protein [Bacteroides sp. 51]|uniref:heparinase II/III domain-containing protein n=1 Tax=Bacteroides sp. 51 TaxID=2302938 RepID=UPI0013D78A46|nr:heparinase II/III family protein [Bacteroides sp. 51]NDV81889.1 heparinase [Bacteroides sp. 51]